MISFTLSLLALIAGYFLYGRFVERVFGPDSCSTPAVKRADGVDYVVLPPWKIFMIQFLNIAGTGPIFGAIMGAWYGPVAYVWIVLGCVFAGATHDYLSGMMSLRHGGAGLPELIGKYLGTTTKNIMLVCSILLLMMVGVVFVYSPAIILNSILGEDPSVSSWPLITIMIVIFAYYIIATLLPIDKIIGKIYPLFAISLLFMAVALLIGLFVKMPQLPELWTDLSSSNLNQPTSILGTEPFIAGSPIFPCLFITIACGAISGFHATQSPLMARCLKHEVLGRPIFYGSMITEGIVALIWATVSMYFFYYGGWREVVSPEAAAAFMAQAGGEGGKTLVQYFNAPTVVELVCNGWLGVAGGVLAIFGVVAAPITSGDTAFRSARLIIAEFLHLEQHTVRRRLYICIPMFALAAAMLVWQMENPDGFNIIWQYFGWSNQAMSVFTLWTITVFLVRSKKPFIITLVPALFMTCVCSTFLFVSRLAFGLAPGIGYTLGGVAVAVALAWFVVWYRKWQSQVKNV